MKAAPPDRPRWAAALIDLAIWAVVLAIAAAASLACTARWWQPGEIAASLRGQQLMLCSLTIAAIGWRARHRRKLWVLLVIGGTFVPAWVQSTARVAPVAVPTVADVPDVPDVPTVPDVPDVAVPPPPRPWTFRFANVLKSNGEFERIAASMFDSGADVIATVETTRSGDQAMLRWLTGSHPHHVFEHESGGSTGLAIYSRWPIRVVHRSPFSLGVIVQELEVAVLLAHTPTPMRPGGWRSREAELGELAGWVAQSRREGRRVVLAGDLNLTAWSPSYHRLLRRTGMRRVGQPWWPTWYARRNDQFFFGLAIDHLLITPDVRAGGLTIGEDLGSDHRPIMATLW